MHHFLTWIFTKNELQAAKIKNTTVTWTIEKFEEENKTAKIKHTVKRTERKGKEEENNKQQRIDKMSIYTLFACENSPEFYLQFWTREWVQKVHIYI